MGQAVHERPRIWTYRLLLNYLWTLAVANVAVTAVFLVDESRSASILNQFAGPGEPSTIPGFLLRYSLVKVGPVLLRLLPLVAAMSALSVVLYVIGSRGQANPTSLKRRLALGWVPAVLLSTIVPDGIYFLAVVWALAVVPASADLYHGNRWRAVECVAFAAVAGLSWFFPMI